MYGKSWGKPLRSNLIKIKDELVFLCAKGLFLFLLQPREAVYIGGKKFCRAIYACGGGLAVGAKETMVVGDVEEIGIEAGDGAMRLSNATRPHDEHASIAAPHRGRMDVEIAKLACPPVDQGVK